MKTNNTLKRAVFLGIIWCVGSLQLMAAQQIPGVLLLIPLGLGLAECYYSLNYRAKKPGVLKLLLWLQGAYYLAGSCYVLGMKGDSSANIFGAVVGLCMVGLIASALVTLGKPET